MRVEELSIRKALAYDSGTADRTGIVIDTAGFEFALFVVQFAAIATSCTTKVKVQQDAAVGMGGAADLLGTGITVADDDDNQLFAIAIVKPRERYLRVYVDKDTSNASGESAIVILGNGRTEDALASITDEITVEKHVSPAEGTA